jgi:hypothetical protein
LPLEYKRRFVLICLGRRSFNAPNFSRWKTLLIERTQLVGHIVGRLFR